MKYDDAFKIGSQCDGYVKCTYAELYNTEYGKLFSIQKQGISTDTSFLRNVDENIRVDALIPIVQATDYIETEKENDYVPVYINPLEAEHIITLLNSRQKIFNRKEFDHIVYVVYLCKSRNMGNGASKTVWTRVYESQTKPFVTKGTSSITIRETTDQSTNGKYFKGYYDYRIEEEKVYRYAYDGLIEGIKNDTLFYVKKCAIDWQPTDIENMTIEVNGKSVNINVAIAEAQNRVDKAKALLGIAAATNII